MPGSQSSKGNPATKRMGNPRRKARRAECWARGEARKQRRREENEARHQANLARRAQQSRGD